MSDYRPKIDESDPVRQAEVADALRDAKAYVLITINPVDPASNSLSEHEVFSNIVDDRDIKIALQATLTAFDMAAAPSINN